MIAKYELEALDAEEEYAAEMQKPERFRNKSVIGEAEEHLHRLNRLQIETYQKAIYETIREYDIGNYEQYTGRPEEDAAGILPPFKVDDFHTWDPRPGRPIRERDKNGDIWPKGSLKEATDYLGRLTYKRNAGTRTDGVTQIWNVVRTPFELARLLNHELQHYKVAMSNNMGALNSEISELNILQEDRKAIRKMVDASTPEGAEALRAMDAYLGAKIEIQKVRADKERAEGAAEDGIISRIKTTYKTWKSPEPEPPGNIARLSFDKGSIKEILKNSKQLRERINRENAESERRNKEFSARLKREAAKSAEDRQYNTLYWMAQKACHNPYLSPETDFKSDWALVQGMGRDFNRFRLTGCAKNIFDFLLDKASSRTAPNLTRRDLESEVRAGILKAQVLPLKSVESVRRAARPVSPAPVYPRNNADRRRARNRPRMLPGFSRGRMNPRSPMFHRAGPTASTGIKA
ncbi:MAG: hypothetical protein AUJ52_11405 [Elusimicrobia bacterium CG1_02_63_36]|nr:MAG: hypothetical protein AUJ52_11405 [Elusimicrobia bacterium CG1_02_63_36]